MCCNKKTFDSEEQAREALRKVPERPTGQIPYRVYKCPHGKHHFSSKEPMQRKR